MISGCQKCQSNLAGTWFSHCSLLFLEDFAMDEDQKPTMLRDLEIDFLKEHLNGFSVEGNYCFGYFEGNRAEMDDLLVSFQALNSTCYVLTESHSKEKNHNRFSQTGLFGLKTANSGFGAKDARGSYTCKSDYANVHDYARKTRIHLQNSRKLDYPAVMQIRCIRVYNDYFINKAKFLSDNSLVMAKKAILKEINTKSKSGLATSFTVPETLSLTKKMNQDLNLPLCTSRAMATTNA
ncbi:unnamed protein product [Pocillopora meandrina]|uniref:Uncharacterized protein n=1 Tax=Pocillopora meandrina TaxID=46732 RepID=A0AAU9Y151_9CNID|nr:unnamed protein product [Pocillopora meandrina]